jgi:hypothetical protein
MVDYEDENDISCEVCSYIYYISVYFLFPNQGDQWRYIHTKINHIIVLPNTFEIKEMSYADRFYSNMSYDESLSFHGE